MRVPLFFVAFLLGCGAPQQILTSPCVDQAATNSGGECPSCASDSDCTILSNTCQLSAFCVNKTSNWQRTAIGCTTPFLANTTPCGCVNSICQSK